MKAEDWISCPGGNAALLRHLVKAVFPDAITGPRAFAAIANNPVDFTALDRKGSARRMRLSATLVQVNHDGDPRSARHVNIVYESSGQLYRVKAGAAVLSIGSWVAKHVVRDLPAEYRAAFDDFFHGPILSVNVALHNWRFLDKLGISAAHWFDGFGFFANVRHPMLVGDRPTPFHPDKPAVLTFYVPFVKQPTLPIAAQGAAGRAELYATSYADYERQIVEHMKRLFARGGFIARRDIAGIVLNRWGHAFISPQPGFYFGTNGRPALREIIRQRFGRIAFGHCELRGVQSRQSAMIEGKRALTQALEVLQ
jgi:spermidine dehydrogenase